MKKRRRFKRTFNRKSHNESAQAFQEQRQIVCGHKLSFAAEEAYTLLRTNLVFSMSDESKCKIIGVISALKGEGKSTTSLNLCYSLAKAAKKVIFVEADMRMPVAAKLFRTSRHVGLSNVLAGIIDLQEAIFRPANAGELFILPAGEIPPNPSELLSSEKMKKVISSLSDVFDYIIVDLPPITAVSDGLAVSKLLSGIIVVVRQNYGNIHALADTMRQLDLIQAKVLGFVVTDSDNRKKSYKRYGKYGSGYGCYKHPYVSEESGNGSAE